MRRRERLLALRNRQANRQRLSHRSCSGGESDGSPLPSQEMRVECASLKPPPQVSCQLEQRHQQQEQQDEGSQSQVHDSLALMKPPVLGVLGATASKQVVSPMQPDSASAASNPPIALLQPNSPRLAQNFLAPTLRTMLNLLQPAAAATLVAAPPPAPDATGPLPHDATVGAASAESPSVGRGRDREQAFIHAASLGDPWVQPSYVLVEHRYVGPVCKANTRPRGVHSEGVVGRSLLPSDTEADP